MHDIKSIFKLPDRAIALYFAIRELGPMESKGLMKVLGKSQATFYRTIGELRQAGLLEGYKPKPKPKPERPKRFYSLASDLITESANGAGAGK